MTCIFSESAIYRTDTVNLDAKANAATTSAGGIGAGITLSGYAATDILRFTLPDGLTHVAWSPWGNPSPINIGHSGSAHWFDIIRDGEASDSHEMGSRTVYDGYEAARAAFPAGGFDQITGATSYTFYILDTPTADNSGGLSIVVDACPCLEGSDGGDPCANLAGYTDADLPSAEGAADATWPVDLQPRNAGINAMFASLSGGPSTLGLEDAVANAAGFWAFSFEAIPVNTRSRVLAFREIAAQLDGRIGVCLVPLFDGKRAAVPPVDAVASGAIAAGATAGAIQFSSGGPPRTGMHFSAGERAYRILTVGAVSSGDTYAVTFWPPVRTAIADGAALDFVTPACRMRLAKDDGMNLTLQDLKFGTANVDFVEDI